MTSMCSTAATLRVAVFFLCALVSLFGSASASVGAQDDGRSAVSLDGRTLFRVGATDDQDSAARASRVEQRLALFVENPGAIQTAAVETDPSDRSQRIITIAGVPIVTVSESDAADNASASVDALAGAWAATIDDALERATSRRDSAWERFFTEVQISVETALTRLRESAIDVVPRVIAATLVIGLFWCIAAVLRWLLLLVFRHIIGDRTVEHLINQMVYYGVWFLGLIVAIDALGIDTETAVAALGLTGLALGFALKDIISNFTSGLLILAIRPFQLGDQIMVGETEGTVEAINLRATEIRTYDGRLTLVPNADVFTSRVVNNTASPIRRGAVELFLGYDADVDAAMDIVTAAAQSTVGVLAEPQASARIRQLGQDDIVAEIRFWTDSRRADFLATSSLVAGNVVRALRDAGVALPDPDVRFLVPRDEHVWRSITHDSDRIRRRDGRATG